MSSNVSEKRLKKVIKYYEQNGDVNTLVKFKIEINTLMEYKKLYKSKFGQIEKKTYDFERTDEDNNIEISLVSSELRTVDDILEYSKIDTTIWEAVKVTTNAWGSENNPSFQIKVWLKKIDKCEIDIQEVTDNIIKKIGKYSVPSIIKRKKDKDSFLWEVGLVDHHLGQLSWDKEVGFDYDVQIAKKLHNEAIDFLISKVEKYKINKILYHFGQDFYNVNSQLNQTVMGTLQDEDGRWQRSFDNGIMVHINAINKLKQIADVDAIQIGGNHDEERIYYAGAVIKAWFKNDKNVYIDNRPISRKYYKYGKNLFGFTHGKEIKLDRLLGLMPIESKQDWVECVNYEWKLGHLHHSEVKQILNEKNGIKVRYLPTLCPVDSWHFSKGYLHNRETQSFLWHPEKGNMVQINFKI